MLQSKVRCHQRTSPSKVRCPSPTSCRYCTKHFPGARYTMKTSGLHFSQHVIISTSKKYLHVWISWQIIFTHILILGIRKCNTVLRCTCDCDKVEVRFLLSIPLIFTFTASHDMCLLGKNRMVAGKLKKKIKINKRKEQRDLWKLVL